MTMTFTDQLFAISFVHFSPLFEQTIITSKTHSCTIFFLLNIFCLHWVGINNWIPCFWIYFCGICIFVSKNIASKLYTSKLQTITKSQIGNFLLTSKLN